MTPTRKAGIWPRDVEGEGRDANESVSNLKRAVPRDADYENEEMGGYKMAFQVLSSSERHKSIAAVSRYMPEIRLEWSR